MHSAHRLAHQACVAVFGVPSCLRSHGVVFQHVHLPEIQDRRNPANPANAADNATDTALSAALAHHRYSFNNFGVIHDKRYHPCHQKRDHLFEIPTLNLAKSQAFYETVLACTMRPEDMGPSQGAVFPYEGDGVSGALLCGPSAPKPGATGALIYLDASPLLDAAVGRALAAGASLACPRVALPPGMGFFAHIIDLDGNRVGLHALA